MKSFEGLAGVICGGFHEEGFIHLESGGETLFFGVDTHRIPLPNRHTCGFLQLSMQ